MQNEFSFKLLLNSKVFLIPSDFRNLENVESSIYRILKTTGQYEIKSNVDETILQSFIDYWVKSITPDLQFSNLIKYKMLSEEFDLMKDLIQIFQKSNPQQLFLISANEKLKKEQKMQKKLLSKKTIKYQQIIHHLFQNTGIKSYTDFLSVKHELFYSIINNIASRVDYLTKPKIVSENGLIYILNENDQTAGVFRNITAIGKIRIPNKIIHQSKEYDITIIHKNAFASNKTITTVEFDKNSSLQTIDNYAFFDSSLESIIIPSSVERIGKQSFADCSKLNYFDFEENSNLKSIKNDAFLNSMIFNLTIPSCIEYIENKWLFDLGQMHKIKIKKCQKVNIKYYEDKFILQKSDPKSDIFDVLLDANPELTTVTIPSFIKIIAPYCFRSCYQLETINFSVDSQLKIIEEYSFSSTKIESIIIPSTVTIIKEGAFKDCMHLEKVEFEKDSQLISIGSYSFYSNSLFELSIPSSVIEFMPNWCGNSLKTINIISNEKQFIKCIDNEMIVSKFDLNSDVYDVLLYVFNNIENLKVPSYIKFIVPFLFYSNDTIKTVEFSNDSQLSFIGENAFEYSSIRSINIPQNVVRIDDDVFNFCEELEKVEFSKQSKIQFIGKRIFNNSAIQKISIPSNLINSKLLVFSKLTDLSIIQNDESCILYKNKVLLGKSDSKSEVYNVLLFAARDIEELEIPFYIKKISPYAFDNCFQLKKIEFEQNSELIEIGEGAFRSTNIVNISIPPSVIEIGNFAFLSCENLENIEIPKNSQLRRIGQKAFSETFIEKIRIPKFLKKIEKGLFTSCQNLKIVEFLPDSELEIIEDNSFSNCAITSISFPQKVSIIHFFAFCHCINLNRIEFDANSRLFYVEDEAFSDCQIEKIIIPSKITKISEGMFNSCFYLKTVEFSEKSQLKVIGISSFHSTSIEKIEIPSSVVRIENFSFSNCQSLKTVTFSKDSECSQICKYAFCTSSIERISVPFKSIDIKSGFLVDTPKLIDVKIIQNFDKNSLNYFDNYILAKSNPRNDVFDVLFFANRNIEFVVIPSSIKTISPFAFNSCRCLQKVSFSNECQIEFFENNTFSKSALKSICIPSSVKIIGMECFSKCNFLSSFEFSENSKIERIEQDCLNHTSINKIIIPKSLKFIGSRAFYDCLQLDHIDISEDSQLESIGAQVFVGTKIKSFYIPSSVSFLDDTAFVSTSLKIIEIGDKPELKEICKNALATYNNDTFVMIPR